MIEIKKVEMKDGYHFFVKVPFDFKDEFKDEFPTAKWNPRLLTWLVESDAEDKLNEFSELLNSKLKQLEDEKKKIEKQGILQSSIDSIDKKIEIANELIESKRVSIEALEKLNDTLSDKKSSLENLEKKLSEKRNKESQIIDNIVEKLSSVININTINSAQKDMIDVMKKNVSSEREKWSTAQSVFEHTYEALKEIGIVSPEIYNIANVSWSSKQKYSDYVTADLSLSAIAKNIKIIEPAPAEESTFKM